MRTSGTLTSAGVRGLMCLGGVVVAVAIAAPASAEPVTTLSMNGPSANRIDIVLLGDGYTADESAKYASDVQTFLTEFFSESPFSDYRAYFNVHRIDVVSQESGADKAPENVFRNTALGAFYYCGSVERLICVDGTLVNGVLTRSVSVTQRDLVVIIVNDTKYGGSGGQWAVLSTNGASAEIAEHEIGHTFGLLADEYVDLALPCNLNAEPIAANATLQTTRASIKWAAWIEPGTPVPTFDTDPGVVGLYEGSQFCPAGKYRPTYNSKMRSLGRPFEQINSEQITKRFYNFVAPIDASLPADATVTARDGAPASFSIETPAPELHALGVRWEVDGTLAGSAKALVLQTHTLAPGPHVVTVTVTDPTPLVRNDPTEVLKDERTWTLIVEGCDAALSSQSARVPRSGGIGTVTATVTPSTCLWAVDSDAAWLVPSITSAGGSAAVTFTAAANLTGGTRTAQLTVAGRLFTVSQDGPPAGGIPSPLPPQPAEGTGLSQTFTFTFHDNDGAGTLDVVNVLINDFLDGGFGCYLAYARSNNVLYLVDDPGTALLPGLVLDHSPGTVGNGQCLVDRAGSSAATAGSVLTLTLQITFSPAFAGHKVIYQAARDVSGGNSGWVQQGVWHVPGGSAGSPGVVSMTPARGGGLSFPFQFTFRDADGYSDLVSATVLINDYLDGRHACYFGYHVPSNTLLLLDDEGTAYLPPLVLGGAGQTENSHCRIRAQGSGATGNGTDLTLTVNVEFMAGHAGERVFYLSAQDATTTSGWHSIGSWTVPAAP